jgi:hypothetical protein
MTSKKMLQYLQEHSDEKTGGIRIISKVVKGKRLVNVQIGTTFSCNYPSIYKAIAACIEVKNFFG